MAQNLESYATDGKRGTTLSVSIPFSASDGEKVAKPDEVSLESGERDRVRCRVPQIAARPMAVRKYLKVPPISQHGNMAEIAQLFGGFEKLGSAVNQLQSLLYAA